MRWRILPASIVLMSLAVAAPQAATGGGSWMKSPDDWVEPGEEVEMVAYVGASNVNSGPWEAYLSLEPMDGDGNFGNDRLALGPVLIEMTGLTGYLSHRVYLSFTLPDDLVPGIYQISVTNPQGDFLGDLIGGHLPVHTQNIDLWYEWPVDEPLVARLPDHAMLADAGRSAGPVSVGEVRRGLEPAPSTTAPPVQVPTSLTTAASAIAEDRAQDPWFLAIALAVAIGCLLLASRVADRNVAHSRVKDNVIEDEPIGAARD